MHQSFCVLCLDLRFEGAARSKMDAADCLYAPSGLRGGLPHYIFQLTKSIIVCPPPHIYSKLLQV